MNLKQVLYSTAAMIGFAALSGVSLDLGSVPANAQQMAVAIDNDDIWVDHHNTLGLGENIPIFTTNLNDGFAALKDGQMVMLRVPYPMGFFAKGLDGRMAAGCGARAATACRG
jgi:hypothetical protein